MTSVKGMTVASVRSELDKIESLVSTAARLIGDGRVIDLGALVRRTNETCDAAVKLPPKDGKSLLPDLELVITQLDALSEQLNKRFGKLPNLQNEAPPSAAASAYGRLQEVER